MSEPAAKRMNAQEFLDWVETQPKGRFELIRGEIFAMAPERAGLDPPGLTLDIADIFR